MNELWLEIAGNRWKQKTPTILTLLSLKVYAKNMLQASKLVCAYNLHCMLNLYFRTALAQNPNIADIF